jgi:hypothetical protein
MANYISAVRLKSARHPATTPWTAMILRSHQHSYRLRKSLSCPMEMYVAFTIDALKEKSAIAMFVILA